MMAGTADGSTSRVLGLERREELRFAGLRELRQRWEDWPKTSGIPLRSAFDPIDMPRLLSRLVLAGIQKRENKFRDYDVVFRYIGSYVAGLFEIQSFTGQALSSVGEAYAMRWVPVADEVSRSRRPATFSSPLQGTERDFIHFELLVLPLSVDGTSVDFVLAGVAETEPPANWPSPPALDPRSLS
jgi:hypothetical protein